MQSYNARFSEETKEEMRTHVRLRGVLPTALKWDAKDIERFNRFIQEDLCPNEKIPMVTKHGSYSVQDLADILVSKIIETIIKLQAENLRLRQELDAWHSVGDNRESNLRSEMAGLINVLDAVR